MSGSWLAVLGICAAAAGAENGAPAQLVSRRRGGQWQDLTDGGYPPHPRGRHSRNNLEIQVFSTVFTLNSHPSPLLPPPPE